jgi:hypothetical protein
MRSNVRTGSASVTQLKGAMNGTRNGTRLLTQSVDMVGIEVHVALEDKVDGGVGEDDSGFGETRHTTSGNEIGAIALLPVSVYSPRGSCTR